MFNEMLKCAAKVMAPVAQGFVEILHGKAQKFVIEKLKDHFGSSEILPKALEKAFEDGLRTVEVAISGPNFYNKTAVKEFSEKFRGDVLLPFLKETGFQEKSFVENCLKDIELLRKEKLFEIKELPCELLAEEVGNYGTQEIKELKSLEAKADEALYAAIVPVTKPSNALTELLKRHNVIVGAATIPFSLAIQKDEMLFRAYYLVNHQGIRTQLQRIEREITEANQEKNRKKFEKLYLQKAFFTKLQGEIEFGLQHVKGELLSAFDVNLAQWEEYFGVISENLGILYAHGKDTIEELRSLKKKGSSDGRYWVSEEGVIYDTKTNLEWYVGQNKDTTWDEAKSWVKHCKVAGGGWRMPTIEELQGLYEEEKVSYSWYFEEDAHLDLHLDPVFHTKGSAVWSEKTEGPSSAWCVYFTSGVPSSVSRDFSYENRGVAVRSGRR